MCIRCSDYNTYYLTTCLPKKGFVNGFFMVHKALGFINILPDQVHWNYWYFHLPNQSWAIPLKVSASWWNWGPKSEIAINSVLRLSSFACHDHNPPYGGNAFTNGIEHSNQINAFPVDFIHSFTLKHPNTIHNTEIEIRSNYDHHLLQKTVLVHSYIYLWQLI